MGHGGDQVVSVLSFNSDDLSSNPFVVYSLNFWIDKNQAGLFKTTLKCVAVCS